MTMTLVDDYLRAVALLLPKDQRDDIVAELRDTVLNRTEAKEAELGRPLTDDETEALLRGVGHPLVVAARYREGPQHVVGPALYPFWLFGVKAAVTLQLAVAGVVFLIRALSSGNVGQAFGHAVNSAVSGAIALIGFATVAAWLIERQGVKIAYLDRWRVRDLRMLEVAAWDVETWRERVFGSGASPPSAVGVGVGAGSGGAWSARTRTGRGSPAGRGLGCIAANSVLVLWWLGVLHFGLSGSVADLRDVEIEPGALADIDWPGLKGMLFWPVLAYGGLGIVQGFWLIARPEARRLHGLFDLASGAALMGIVAWIWSASPLAPAVRVSTLADFLSRLRGLHPYGGPVALAPALSILLAGFGVAGLCLVAQGLWEALAPRRPAKSGWTPAATR